VVVADAVTGNVCLGSKNLLLLLLLLLIVVVVVLLLLPPPQPQPPPIIIIIIIIIILLSLRNPHVSHVFLNNTWYVKMSFTGLVVIPGFVKIC